MNDFNLLYHFVCLTKCQRVITYDYIDEILIEICKGIEARYDYIEFLEIGADKDNIHFLILSLPNYSPLEIITTVKAIIESRISVGYPELNRLLGDEPLWSDDFLVNTVDKYDYEQVIQEYVKNQGKQDEYKSIAISF